MADASKLKQLRRSGLGSPPPMEEARSDLDPAQAVAAPGDAGLETQIRPAKKTTTAHRPTPSEVPPSSRIDGRTLRRSGRTVQFATRVSPEFDKRIRQIAQRDGLLIVEVLERALQALEHRGSRKIAAR